MKVVVYGKAIWTLRAWLGCYVTIGHATGGFDARESGGRGSWTMVILDVDAATYMEVTGWRAQRGSAIPKVLCRFA